MFDGAIKKITENWEKVKPRLLINRSEESEVDDDIEALIQLDKSFRSSSVMKSPAGFKFYKVQLKVY